ncbi:hypothetical protein DVK85_06520 [Flavobacterium arcticum]|uniref:Phenylalanyl-tRNA synthetase subunit alpha n=1 Tax=Flavobacterium arcticum TaxID=1784713 RepID=A0A345HBF3_9FLAO|nr:hypothetical protein [Flavobacterium arcticum]AXG73913.1 hypothetical protein DVK85_06520 [Flavobacterium arcticum]KAF2508890.1 hypothetical protein E0W72_10005 [Flavobacterium arcticum]
MKKDIHIPKVESVYVAILQEWSEEFMDNTWYAYLVNGTGKKLESVIVVSNASGMLNGEERKTSMLRHVFPTVAPNTAIRIELVENGVLVLNNSFMVTYFKDGVLYDKNFVVKANTIAKENVQEIPVIFKDGILAE